MFVTRGAPSKIRAYITDADGDPLPKAGAPEVSVSVVRDSDGAAVVTGAASFEDDGVVVSELPAQDDLDLLTVTWEAGPTTVTTTEEILGARLCSLAAVSEDLSTPPAAATLRFARDLAELFLEDECGVAFRPRYAREQLDGSGERKVFLSRSRPLAVRSASADGVAVSTVDLKLYPSRAVWREAGWPSGALNVDIAYEHGFAAPVPAAGRCAALLGRHIAAKRPSNLDDRSTQISTDAATYSLIVPGLRGMATAIPEVNAFVESWHERTVG